MKKIYLATALVLLALSSCRKDQKILAPFELSATNKQNLKTSFSKTLAIALEKEPTLRAFIRAEALKQFDKDNDVLFHMVKDVKLENNKTFYETIVQYATSKVDFDKSIESLPTLTIMVPEIPNFNPIKWNTNTEIPVVAIAPELRYENVFLYNSKGDSKQIPYGLIPGFPVVVVKENERVSVAVSGVDRSPKSAVLLKSDLGKENITFANVGNMKFSFSNEAFNGLNKSVENNSTGHKLSAITSNGNTLMNTRPPRIEFSFPFIPILEHDPLVVEAFDHQLDWQRDYIYYGLNPDTGIDKGKFNIRVVEHIVAIRMADEFISRFQDHDHDPKVVEVSNGRYHIPSWTDGYFDLRISVLINAKNGIGTEKTIIMNVKGSDIYDFKFRSKGSGPGRPDRESSPHDYFYYEGVTPKIFYVNEPIVGWDLENYGAGWKFIVTEYDPSEEIITTHTNTSTYATNFEFNSAFGEKTKNGIKFGASAQFVNTSTYQVKTTKGSDDIGQGTLEFGTPIILKKEQINPSAATNFKSSYYVTHEVKCGPMFLTVAPKLITR